ncbi:LysR family transcriptional regulator [Motilimonas pumila]|uniref:LysR family transcriptional regulator n=1 Tax=Motilimonas pumila TaxID=2303987 RepID=A0A418YA05_9GAMM|nr:LysR family transcriptional regulator [Motilimonas pumila]RJG38629.1 LysR family transcriptional regulator [Motilimonas pumila]
MLLSNQFKRLDLNLLKVLVVLIEVQNTRKAAQILYTSQPSISRSLQKLRHYFDDELFIRSQHGLAPTAKLNDLKQTVLPAMQQLAYTLEPQDDFNPALLDEGVNIAINGFIANSISAQLTHYLFQQAPNIKVNILDWSKLTLEQLVSGEIDIGVNYYPLELSKQVYQKQIAKDGFLFVCRQGHPLAGTLLNDYQGPSLDLASLVVSDWNDTIAIAPTVLASAGISAEVKVRSSYLHSLLAIVKDSDVLFPCSKLLAQSLSHEFALLAFPDTPTMPVSEVGITMGRKHRNQPKMRWLESCISEVFSHS